MFKNFHSMFKNFLSIFKKFHSVFKKLSFSVQKFAFSVQNLHSAFKNVHSVFKNLHSVFKTYIQCSKSLFSVQRFHSMFKDFIQCSKISFKVQRFHSMFKDFIQCSICSFKVQKVHSMFKKFIQCSKSSFKAQKVHSTLKNFIQFKKFIQYLNHFLIDQKAFLLFKSLFSVRLRHLKPLVTYCTLSFHNSKRRLRPIGSLTVPLQWSLGLMNTICKIRNWMGQANEIYEIYSTINSLRRTDLSASVITSGAHSWLQEASQTWGTALFSLS